VRGSDECQQSGLSNSAKVLDSGDSRMKKVGALRGQGKSSGGQHKRHLA